MQINHLPSAFLRVALSIFLLSTFALQAQNTNIKPKITSATLYPNAAEVNLFKEVNLKKGTHTISIGGIPDDVRKDRVTIDIDGDVRVVSSQLNPAVNRLNLLDESERLEALNKLDEEIELLEKSIGLIREERAMLNENRKITGNQTLTANTWREAGQFYRSRMEQLQTDESKLTNKLRESRKNRFKLFGKLGKSLMASRRLEQTIEIELEVLQTGNISFNLTYLTQRAGWQPRYEIRSAFPEKKLAWSYQAELFQHTGQAWEDIDITLTSAEPLQDKSIPELPIVSVSRRLNQSQPPWPPISRVGNKGTFSGSIYQNRTQFVVPSANIELLDQYHRVIAATTSNEHGHFSITSDEPVSYIRFFTWNYRVETLTFPQANSWLSINLKPDENAFASADDVMSNLEQLDMESKSPGIRGARSNETVYFIDGVKVRGTMQTPTSKTSRPDFGNLDLNSGAAIFHPEERITLPSSQNTRTITLRRHTSEDLNHQHIAVPRMTNQVYLIAKQSGMQGMGLLPGNARIFLGNRQVGVMRITPEHIGDTLELSFGEDKNLHAEYKPKHAERSRRFLSRRVTETHVYDLIISNRRAQSVDVDLRDRLPVSDHSDVSITLIDGDGAEHNTADGALQWDVSIPANSNATKTVKFEVTRPKEE
ncbi:MAG: DUF4139 domain-containing protein [Cryomorphaceae bacterium]|nr:DUF4139 domain-containing protein [Cryomorphaceae bacterium]